VRSCKRCNYNEILKHIATIGDYACTDKIKEPDMPNSLDAIKGMFDEASPDEKNQFLFKALQKIDDNMKVGFTEMKRVCECRKKA